MTDKEYLLTSLKTAFRIITPWKMRYYPDSKEETIENTAEYVQGWNDCIKEIKKNRAKFIKFVEEQHEK